MILGLCAAVLAPTARVARATEAAPVGPAGPDCGRLACVALTFDDGPSEATSALLDDLADARVRATFFVVGDQARWWPTQLRREVAEGHAIGNHSLTHPYLATLTPAQVHEELLGGENAIAEITGTRPLLVRPPYGNYSAAVRSFGHPLVLWDVETLDWQHHDPAQVLARVAAQVRPGSIVLMHDTQNQLDTLAAVPRLIRNLRAAGYTLVTVPELLAPHTLVPGAVYRDRASAARPAEHPQPWDTVPPTAAEDTAAGVAGTVLWQYASGADTGPAEAETVEHGLRPGECRNLTQPPAAATDTRAFALRNLTGHTVELHDRRDCTEATAALTPGGEQYGPVRSFRVRTADGTPAAAR